MNLNNCTLGNSCSNEMIILASVISIYLSENLNIEEQVLLANLFLAVASNLLTSAEVKKRLEACLNSMPTDNIDE